MSIIAVIPALNEEKTIASVICSLRGVVDKVIIVNDCSSDNTASTSRDNGAFVIDNNTNLGYSKSLDKGILAALNDHASVVLTIDADGQHPVDIGKKMISLINDFGYDVVLGTRIHFHDTAKDYFQFIANIDMVCLIFVWHEVLFTPCSRCNRSCQQVEFIGNLYHHQIFTKGLKVKSIDVNILDRKDNESRFGTSLRGEIPILRALFQVVTGDL